ncbi:MAG TPA: transposase [Pyrinomonadaceae bacterium]|jgi:putative DNA methylase|nr:transposase [Pyrinomonadaceae bacterium]
MEGNKLKGWYSRGYLPHFDGGEILQFITFHLADALPLKVVESWKRELEREKREEAQKILFWRIEKFVDRSLGKCYLAQTEIAELVQDALLYFDNEKYKLISWVIMPNHVHFLLRPFENHTLEKIIHSIKSFTAQKANQILNRRGKFWQEEYFDRYIRNYEHFEKTINYIELNPVKAKLCEKPTDWKFSSAYFNK